MNKFDRYEKAALALLLGLGTAHAQALPLSFASVTYGATVFADVDGVADGPYDANSPPALLPLVLSASATTPDGVANANAVADDFLLAASSEAVNTTAASSSASAVARFFGTFTTAGTGLAVNVAFEDFIDTLGLADVGSTLFVLLQVDGATLLDTSYTTSELIGAEFMTLPGLSGVLDISLVSASAAAADSSGFNLASAGFSLDSVGVPEPATLGLILGGMGLLGLRRGAGRRRLAN